MGLVRLNQLARHDGRGQRSELRQVRALAQRGGLVRVRVRVSVVRVRVRWLPNPNPNIPLILTSAARRAACGLRWGARGRLAAPTSAGNALESTSTSHMCSRSLPPG